MQKGVKLELMQGVIDHFDLHALVALDEMEDLASSLRTETYKRGELVADCNTTDIGWYFVESGLLRAYYYRGDTQITNMFVKEGSCITLFEKYYGDRPTEGHLEAVEPTRLYILDRADAHRLRMTSPGVAEFHRQMLIQYLMLSQRHLDLLKFETAEMRYRKFSEQNPQLILRVPSIYIASYLGLTPETVSRVRSRLAKHPEE